MLFSYHFSKPHPLDARRRLNGSKNQHSGVFRTSRAASPLFDGDPDASIDQNITDQNITAQGETQKDDQTNKDVGQRVDDLAPDFYSITLERLSRGNSRANSRQASPEPEFRHVKLRKTPSRENLALEDAVRVKLTHNKTNLRKTGSLFNLESRSRQGSRAGSRAGSPVRDASGGAHG